MTAYFEEMESIYYRLQDQPERILKVVAEHYIGQNPEIPFTYRAFSKAGIMQNEAGQYELNFKQRFPDTPLGYYGYACGLVWSDTIRTIDLVLNCYGPVQLFFNDALLYRSTAVDEVKVDHQVMVEVQFQRGWNQLFIKARNTTAGFGCAIGAVEAKVRILNVLAPFEERKGQAGWVYSKPVEWDCFADGRLPDGLQSELASDPENKPSWLPQVKWTEAEAQRSACERIFGIRLGKKAYAWSKLQIAHRSDHEIKMIGTAAGPIRIWVNDEEIVSAPQGGAFEAKLSLSIGLYDVLVETVCGHDAWDWQCTLSMGPDEYNWLLPHRIHGYDGFWLYLGTFDSDKQFTSKQLLNLHRVHSNQYWQVDLAHTWIRPYYENALLSNQWTTSGLTNFARWDYPLGVTMYGLLQTGRQLDRKDIIHYALQHIKACTQFYEYSVWDMEQYGFPALNQQLVLIQMLDNCGSFGSAMLEAYMEDGDQAFLRIAEVIAAFIAERLERREDGAFYRICKGEYSENSMWADDLYMSTPFMRRYFEVTGDRAFLDDAAEQFILYKQYLFMPEEQIMSHVYDFKYNTATNIPWGRGNGWSIFSLSELLEILPEDHVRRRELLRFYNELCEGYLALQGENGLWRQVLNDPDAYEESSCTAMFIYAFARGVYHGWLSEPERYIQAAIRGWQGLSQYSIDRHGNVHGVCSGSRYAFSADYYKYDLKTVTNDNHGIGIVMLAGVEIAKLLHWMRGTVF